MSSKKRGRLLVFLALFLFLISVSALAEDGCYLFPEGSEQFYCQDVTREEAATDCDRFDDCNLNTHFVSQSCDQFTECRQVKCNVDCDFHALGKCQQLGLDRGETEDLRGQEVTPENDALWCAPRCSRAGPYCSNGLVTRWESQLSAFRTTGSINIDAEDYNLNTEQCLNWCQTELAAGTLEGFIYAESEGNPLIGAEISLDNGERTTSDEQGGYSFASLLPRSYLVRVNAPGYTSQSRDLIINSNQVTEQNFILQEAGDLTISGNILPERATISWSGPVDGTLTTNTGTYEITGLIPGDYSIRASRPGYESQERQVTLETSLEEINFELTPLPVQGIVGETYIEGDLTPGVRIYVNGAVRSFSNLEGYFQISLGPGNYQLTASSGDFATEQPYEVIVEESQETPLRVDLIRNIPICNVQDLKTATFFEGQAVLGEAKIELTWGKPCPEVVGYEIKRVNDNSIFEVSPVSTSFRDEELEWGSSYQYEIVVLYENNQRSEPLLTEEIYVGDGVCAGKYNQETGWQTFCLNEERTTVWSCQDNQLVQRNDCSVLGNGFCSPLSQGNAICKDAGICSVQSQGADPFGLYFTRDACYGTDEPEVGTSNFCYFDSSLTVVNSCQVCTEVQSCFDYNSKDACQINNCLTSECQWVNSGEHKIVDYSLIFPELEIPPQTTEETGKGYCVPQDYEGDSCSSCGPESDLFSNNFCTAEVCTSLGSCFSDSQLTSCVSCPEQPSLEANCYTYQTELECTNNNQGLEIINGQVIHSEDSCNWNRCAWVGSENGAGSCVKDGDNNEIDDCSEFAITEQDACKADLIPPSSMFDGARRLSLNSPQLTFTISDNFFVGSFNYCLLGVGPNVSDYCEEFTTISLSEFSNEEQVEIDILSQLTENINQEAYRLKFFSKDRYFNQEGVQEIFVSVDNVLPYFAINEEILTESDKTDLTVFLAEESETMSCEFNLLPVLPRANPLTNRIGEEVQGKTVTFTMLSGVYYNLTVTCTDLYGNSNSKSKFYAFDLEQGINIIKPSLGDVLATTKVEFMVDTDVAAICELWTTSNEKVADFLADEELKSHSTGPLTNFVEGNYLSDYKVVCKDLLTNQEKEDYFSFSIDFTPPKTQIVLKEGLREEQPISYNWERSFVENVNADFICESDGFECQNTFVCLGDGCENRNNPEYQLYEGTIELTENTRICYFSDDLGGNFAQPFCGDILIEGYGITLLNPTQYIYQGEKWGISKEPEFDFRFFTKIPTKECKFDTRSGFDYQDTPLVRTIIGQENIYSLERFPTDILTPYPERGGVKNIFVVCENLDGDLSPEQKINLEYDPTPPEITKAEAEPDKIFEGTRTILKVDTDDKTECRYSEFSEDYSTMEFAFEDYGESHETVFAFSFLGTQKEFNLNVQCKNGAGELSQLETIKFEVDYSANGNIESLSPNGLIGYESVLLEVVTNKPGTCTYIENGTVNSFVDEGPYHSKSLEGLEEGEHLFLINCDLSGQIVESQILFTIDLTGPAITSINDGNRTCSLNEINAFVYTNDQNVSSYNYKLLDKGNRNVVYQGLSTGGQPLRISGLNLTTGRTYSLKVQAEDSLGNVGLEVESDGVLATNQNDSSCQSDFSSPKLSILTNTTCTSVNVEIYCDDEGGCRNINYGIDTSADSCSVTSNYVGSKLKLDQSNWVCYEAEDVSGNKISGKKLVVFQDSDGDGIANSCDRCPSTKSGRSVDGTGCSLDETANKEELISDLDGDSLPDYWERIYDSDQCPLKENVADSNNDGVDDGNEDYDKDGRSNYEEYLGKLNPCLDDKITFTDKEKSQEGDLPTFETTKSNLLAWILLIIGLVFMFGSVGYLVYFYKFMDRNLPSTKPSTPKSKTTYPSIIESWREKLAERRKAREKRLQERQRENLFSGFTKKSPSIPKLDSTLNKKIPHPEKVKVIADHYMKNKEEMKKGLNKEEKNIFSKLEDLTKNKKNVKKEDAAGIISELRKLSKKRKK